MDTDEEVEIITDKEIKCEIEEDSESSDDSEEYFCDQCPSKFPSQGKLERHKKVPMKGFIFAQISKVSLMEPSLSQEEEQEASS